MRQFDSSGVFMMALGAYMAGNGTALLLSEIGTTVPDPTLTGATFLICGFVIGFLEYWIMTQKEL